MISRILGGSQLRIYCKAYHLKDLRQFHTWSQHASEDEADLADETVVYLWDDFTVVRAPVAADTVLLWEEVSPQWQEFCRVTLGFEVPEDLRSLSGDSREPDSVL